MTYNEFLTLLTTKFVAQQSQLNQTVSMLNDTAALCLVLSDKITVLEQKLELAHERIDEFTRID